MKKISYIQVNTTVPFLARVILVVINMAIILYSCVQDDFDNSKPGSGGDVRITLTIQVPGGSNNMQSRAMPADEETVNEVQLLLFKPSGGALVGNYPAEGSITTDPADSRNKSFTVTVIEGTFDIMVLTNSNQIISAAGLSRDMSREQVSRHLRLEQTAKFDVAGSTLFPCWGEMNNAVIKDGATLNEIPVYRALARIDILLSDEVKNDFTLETVTVYHWQNQMALLPDSYNAGLEKVTAATVTGSGLSTTTFTYSGAEIDSGEKIESKIYLNETPNPGEGDFPEMPCLILGGQYGGESRYYRVDFFGTVNEARVYHDLLRNHRYHLTVEKILSSGSDSEDDAYKSPIVNIETNIAVWNESDAKNIIVDGEYWLRVDPAEFTLAREEHQPAPVSRAEPYSPRDYYFEIESNTNWTIDQSSITYFPVGQNNWFSLNHWSGDGDLANMEIYVTENTTGASRTATFTVSAGTIRFPVTVTQTIDRMTWIRITDMNGDEIAEIDIKSKVGQSEKYEFIVEWYPDDWDSEVELAAGANADGVVEYADNEYAVKAETLQGGRKYYELRFKEYEESDINTGITGGHPNRATDVTFKVGSVTASLPIKNSVVHLVYNPTLYRLDFLEQNLDIYANIPFTVSNIDDPYGILTPAGRTFLQGFARTGTGVLTGQTSNRALTFGQSTAAKDGKTVKVTFSFPLFDMPDKTIELEAYHLQPNSYIVEPGGSVHIPVRKAWRAWSQFPMESQIPEGPMSCELMWQGVDGLISEVSLTPQHSQHNIDSEILVRTNRTAGEGNAVVALKIGADIVWSWHLWVTDYDAEDTSHQYTYTGPNGNTLFMGRNLGAFANSPADNNERFKSQGLFYQCGRKDPFPPAKDILNSTTRSFVGNHADIYYGSNSARFGTAPHQGWTSNLPAYEYSVRNPMSHITTSANPHYWHYSHQRLWYIALSGEVYKTEFDPCPEGWSVPLKASPWGATNEFWDPTPSTNYNVFGYVRTDGYYKPATGYIDQQGNYRRVGYFAGSHTCRYTVIDGIYYARALYIEYQRTSPTSISWGYTDIELSRSSATTVRCSKGLD